MLFRRCFCRYSSQLGILAVQFNTVYSTLIVCSIDGAKSYSLASCCHALATFFCLYVSRETLSILFRHLLLISSSVLGAKSILLLLLNINISIKTRSSMFCTKDFCDDSKCTDICLVCVIVSRETIFVESNRYPN